MSKKTYETQFLLGAKVQGSLAKGFGFTQKGLHGIQRQAEAGQRAVNKISGAMKGLIGLAAGYVSFNAVMSITKQCSQAYQESVIVQTKLSTVMKERTKATDAEIQSVLKLAGAQQRLGVIDDDTQIAGAQQLATFVKRSDTINKLLPAMNNLLAQQKGVNATSEDAVNIGNLMGKVFTGQVGALRRVGITFSKAQERVMKYGNEQQKAAMLARVITENVGQMNASLAKTGPGKLALARNMYGELQEQIGEKILPLQIKFAEMFLKAIPGIEKLIPVLDKLPPILDKVLAAVDWVIKNWGTIGPLLEGVVVAMVAYKAITLGMAVAQWILNGAMLANPIGLIVAGIAALIAAGYLLIKNWDKVTAFFTAAWKKIWALFDNKYIQVALLAFAPIIGLPVIIIKNWDKIKVFMAGLWAGIKAGAAGMGNFFKGVFDGVVGVFKGYVNIWISLINFVIGALNKVSIKVPKGVPKIGGQTFGFNIAKIPMLAKGTDNWRGGLAVTSENGPELLNLPRGTSVTPADKTKSLLDALSGGGRGPSFTFAPQITIQGSATQADVQSALDQSQVEFERRMDAYFRRRRRLSFA